MSSRCSQTFYLLPPGNNSTISLRIVSVLETVNQFYAPIHHYLSYFLILLSFVLNFFILVVLSQKQMRKLGVNVMMMSIAFCDFFCSMFAVVYLILEQLNCGSAADSYPRALFVLIYDYMTIGFHSSSIFLGVGMAFCRIMSLTFSNKNSELWHTPRYAVRLITTIFCIVLTLSLVFIPFQSIDRASTINLKGSSDPFDMSSLLLANNCFYLKATHWLLGVGYKMIPCFLLLLFSAMLLQKIRTSRRKTRLLQMTQNSCYKGRVDRSSSLIVSVLIIFLLTELPQAIVHIFGALFISDFLKFSHIHSSLLTSFQPHRRQHRGHTRHIVSLQLHHHLHHLQPAFSAVSSPVLANFCTQIREETAGTECVACSNLLNCGDEKLLIGNKIASRRSFMTNTQTSSTLESFQRTGTQNTTLDPNWEFTPFDTMKMLVGLLAVLAVVSAEVHQFNIGYRPNLRQRMNAEGKLAEYEKQRNELLAKKSIQLAQGSSPIIDYEDMAYMVQITLGTPAQNFVLFIDSGSSNLWVPDITCAAGKDATCGSYCKSTPYDACLTFCQEECCTKTVSAPNVLSTGDACQSKHRFNSSLSSSYISNGQKFDMTYNTGEVKGFFGADTFCFTNTTACCTGQVFGQATTIGEAFGKQPEDGIIGLGWPALAVNQQTPPLFNLMNQGKLDMPYFVVYLARIGPTSQINGGSFTVGGLDTAHCDSNVDWVPLTTQTFWQFKLSGVSSGSYSQSPTSGWQAAADTAASFIGAPKSVVSSLAKAVGATYVPLSGAYFMDCDAVVPDIVFTINGKTYNMPSTSFVVSAGPGPCMFAFYDLTAGGFYPAWMLGPPFMRAYCHTHDMQNGRLGLSKVL